MSGRAIRRYRETLLAKKESEESITNVSDSSPSHSPRITSNAGAGLLFSLLDEEPSDEEGTSIAEEHAQRERNEAYSSTAVDKETVEFKQAPLLAKSEAPDPGLLSESTNSKKKKRKKKSKTKKSTSNDSSRANDPDWIALNEPSATSTEASSSKTLNGYIPKSFFSKEDDDNIRKEAKKIMISIESMCLTEADQTVNDDTSEASTNPLLVETRFLNSEAELKKIFGSKAVETERRSGRDADAQVARRRRRPPPRAHLRNQLSLVNPRESWYGYAPGLTMDIDAEAMAGDTSGVRYFRYRYEPSYRILQDEYRLVIEQHNPNLLVEFVSMHPFHVDGLLQLAELHRQMGEMDRASEQIERSIFVLQTSWNVMFKPYDGTCRLRFDVLENRSLYVALFRYSQLLTRRGLHRTALEISKLLLNFDPEKDPMGVLMLSDSYALLSGEYSWVRSMYEHCKYVPLKFFPNFAASSAIAIEAEQLGLGGSSTRRGTRKEKSVAISGDSDENSAKLRQRAESTLVEALLTFPMLLKPILQAIRDDAGVWAEYLLYDEDYYSAGVEDCGVLVRISRVYAERSKLLWNSASQKNMLSKCARLAGELYRESGIERNPQSWQDRAALANGTQSFQHVARCVWLRADAIKWLQDSGFYSALQIDDFTDRSNVPRELLTQDTETQIIGDRPRREVTLTEGAWEFLQSILPWREAGDAQ